MSKHIHTKFDSAEEAKWAQEYLKQNGFTVVYLNWNEVIIVTSDDNWISAYEMVHSLGGTFDQDEELLDEIEQEYEIDLDAEITDQEIEVDMVDPGAYVDANLGYGDYEIIEPYILHRYNKLVQESETDKE